MWLKLRTSSPSSSVALSADAVGVVSGGDGLHRVGEGFDGLGDLLGEMQREPTAGEQRERGHHEQEQHVEGADLAALAVGLAVGVDCVLEAGDSGGHAVGHGQSDDDGAALLDGGGTESVVSVAEGEDGQSLRWAAARMVASMDASTTRSSPGWWPESVGAGVAILVDCALCSGSHGLTCAGAPVRRGMWNAATGRASR